MICRIRSDLIIHTSLESPERFLLEDLESGRAFTFKKREFAIITLLDGMSSLETIARMVALETGTSLSISNIARFVERLNQLGLLEQNEKQTHVNLVSRPNKRGHAEMRFERLSRLLRFVAKIFFSSLSGYSLFALTILMLVAEAFFWHDAYVQDIQRYFSWPTMLLMLFFIYTCLPLMMFAHEIGHLLAALHLLQRLYPIRIYYWPFRANIPLTPAAVWSTSDRSSRMVIALAGLYFQVLLLLLIGIIWRYMGQQPVIGLICIALSIPLIGSFLMNILPTYPGLPEKKTDGYFALSYLLNISNLAARARTYCTWKNANTGQGPPSWFIQLTHFQRAGLVCYVSVLPWLDLVLLLGAFCSVSIWLFWPIHTTGLVVIVVIASWLVSPYLSLLKQGIALLLKPSMTTD